MDAGNLHKVREANPDGSEGDVMAGSLKSLVIDLRVLEPIRLEERRFEEYQSIHRKEKVL